MPDTGRPPVAEGDVHDIIPLTRELCAFETNIVSDDNERLFARLQEELPFSLLRFASGEMHNGWTVADNWHVDRAVIMRDGEVVYDAKAHPLGVATNSHPFTGDLDWEELKAHLVTNPELPDAYMFHSIWQIRTWDRDWALTVPYEIYETLGPGRYRVELETRFEPGEMIVGEYEKKGRSDEVILFNTNTCHRTQANDGFAAVAMLVRLFQWLAGQDTYYTYRLVLGPEFMGSVFYMRDKPYEEIERIVSAVFAEMPGTPDPLRIASTFLGEQALDRAFRNAARHHSRGFENVPWREGCGNDETLWEAPGHEIPTVEITRARHYNFPYPEYHSSRDNADLMEPGRINEFLDVLKRTIGILERNCTIHRHFDGLICLSHPDYGLYFERHDPTVDKGLDDEAEKWGHLLDSLLRYMDGSITVLDIAEKHALPFEPLRDYLQRFADKGLVTLEFASIERPPLSRARPAI